MRIITLPEELIPPLEDGDKGFWDRRTILRSNSFLMMAKRYQLFGFTAAPIKRQKSNLSIRIVWIYPEDRDKEEFCFYEPAMTVTIPLTNKDEEWSICHTSTSHYSDVFEQYFEGWKAQDIFSDQGLDRIALEQKVSEGAEHPRTKKRRLTREFIRNNKKLWDNPEALVIMLREAGLYSKNVPIAQNLTNLKVHLERFRSEEQ